MQGSKLNFVYRLLLGLHLLITMYFFVKREKEFCCYEGEGDISSC